MEVESYDKGLCSGKLSMYKFLFVMPPPPLLFFNETLVGRMLMVVVFRSWATLLWGLSSYGKKRIVQNDKYSQKKTCLNLADISLEQT